jgi:HEAT repeat protein
MGDYLTQRWIAILDHELMSTIKIESSVSKGDTPTTAEALIQLALSAPEEAEDYRQSRWHFVYLLQCRGEREVLDQSLILTKSSNPEERQLGIHILGQLGIPNRTFPDECLTTLVGLLGHEFDPLILQDIGIALGHLNDPRSIEPQLKFCLHLDWEVRYGVVHGLSGHDDERAIAALIRLSADDYPQVRNWATFGLGTLIEVDTPAIRSALYQRFITEDVEDDETAEIYGEALVGLANRKDERILPRLIEELMSNRVSTLAIEAAEALADERLYSALLQLQKWWKRMSELEDALSACCPNQQK